MSNIKIRVHHIILITSKHIILGTVLKKKNVPTLLTVPHKL